nr:hypothetical protein [Elusimicrobiota bacterium]
MKNKQYIYLNLTLFAAAFGLLEAGVVVYLRKLFYPAGFVFPLKWIPADIVYVEILREISTMVILFSVARLASRKFYRSLAAFLYMFGIWDIFYYLSLKFLIGWPPSIFTWDILYLIPITWTAPVIAPIICAITMIAGAFLIEKAVFE